MFEVEKKEVHGLCVWIEPQEIPLPTGQRVKVQQIRVYDLGEIEHLGINTMVFKNALDSAPPPSSPAAIGEVD